MDHRPTVETNEGYYRISPAFQTATRDVEHRQARVFDLPVNILDSSKLRHETGWEPTVTFAEGIRRTVEWIKTLKPEHSGSGFSD